MKSILGGVAGYKIVRKFAKYEYLIGVFVPKLEDNVEVGHFMKTGLVVVKVQ